VVVVVVMVVVVVARWVRRRRRRRKWRPSKTESKMESKTKKPRSQGFGNFQS